jgi:hypothetical protein
LRARNFASGRCAICRGCEVPALDGSMTRRETSVQHDSLEHSRKRSCRSLSNHVTSARLEMIPRSRNSVSASCGPEGTHQRKADPPSARNDASSKRREHRIGRKNVGPLFGSGALASPLKDVSPLSSVVDSCNAGSARRIRSWRANLAHGAHCRQRRSSRCSWPAKHYKHRQQLWSCRVKHIPMLR